MEKGILCAETQHGTLKNWDKTAGFIKIGHFNRQANSMRVRRVGLAWQILIYPQVLRV